MEKTYTIFPLGDAAITLDLGNRIDESLNDKALTLQKGLASLHLPGVLDIIVAYSSVSVFYDPAAVIAGNQAKSGNHISPGNRIRPGNANAEEAESALESSYPEGHAYPGGQDGAYTCMAWWLEKVLAEIVAKTGNPGAVDGTAIVNARQLIRIPVCYEPAYGPDLDWLAREKGLAREDIVGLHSSPVYRVYMIGFLPGFPYLGKVDPMLQTARKPRPVPVAAGSVGIAGDQTGIYPLRSPGGWQIIGRTPLKIFDPGAAMRVTIGDPVQFYPVTAAEFQQMAIKG